MLIKFNDTGEFLEELKKEFSWDHGGKPILRLTGERKSGQVATHLSAVATIKNGEGDVLRLDKFVGDLWGIGQDDDVIKQYEAVRTMVEAAAKDIKIEVRAGVFVP